MLKYVADRVLSSTTERYHVRQYDNVTRQYEGTSQHEIQFNH